MTLSALGIFSAAGAGGAAAVPAYELIQTVVLGSSQASITFSSLGTYSSTYKHLQIRGAARSDRATFSIDSIRMLFDSNVMTDGHRLWGNGTTVATVNEHTDAEIATNVAVSGSFGGFVIDILDFYSTTKNKTVKSLSGTFSADAGGFSGKTVQLSSSFRNSTSAISTITLDPVFGTNLVAGTRISLYGIRG
jgi:hypothetical protein